MPRFTIRFSIWHVQAAVLLVALLVGLRLYISPQFGWRDLWALLLGLVPLGMVGSTAWVLACGGRLARFFAVGFLFGAVLEMMAFSYWVTHVRLASGTAAGWYPFTLFAHRALISRGLPTTGDTMLIAMVASLGLSGTLCGGIAATLCEFWTRASNARRKAPSA